MGIELDFTRLNALANKAPVDEYGTKTDCFAYQDSGSRASCNALNGWYNKEKKNRCGGCPFYKTHEELQSELQGGGVSNDQ